MFASRKWIYGPIEAADRIEQLSAYDAFILVVGSAAGDADHVGRMFDQMAQMDGENAFLHKVDRPSLSKGWLRTSTGPPPGQPWLPWGRSG